MSDQLRNEHFRQHLGFGRTRKFRSKYSLHLVIGQCIGSCAGTQPVHCGRELAAFKRLRLGRLALFAQHTNPPDQTRDPRYLVIFHRRQVCRESFHDDS